MLTQARVWTNADATEAALKAVNHPRILHIATHGFFLPDQPTAKPSETRGLGLTSEAPPRGPQQENPMLRSGLILAGVNQKHSGAGEDGVLTAQEAAGLNLFGTKLVVLSACETGLGDVRTAPAYMVCGIPITGRRSSRPARGRRWTAKSQSRKRQESAPAGC